MGVLVPPLADLTATATLILAGITLALVIATIALVLVTRAGTDEARADAKAELELLRRQFGAGHRPLLVDVLRQAPVPHDMEFVGGTERPLAPIQLPGMAASRAIDPRTVFVMLDGARVYISAPMRNVGSGLAVLDRSGIAVEGAGLGQLESRAVQRHHVPVNETTRVELVAIYRRDDRIPTGTTWRISVPYCDFAGEQHTVATVQLALRGDDANGPWFVERVEQRSARDQEPLQESARHQEPHDDGLPEAGLSERGDADRQRVTGVTDLWGNPISKRKRRNR